MHHHHHGGFLDGLPFLADSTALPIVMLVAGLVGGLTHCVGMCGPFVLVQVERRLASRPLLAGVRLQAASAIPYHLGRATTYIALGGLAGLIGDSLADLPGFGWLSGVLLILAAGWFALQSVAAIRRLLPAAALGPVGRAIGAAIRPFLTDPNGMRGFVLGQILGLLPCGLLYGALAAAAGSGGPLQGMLAMAAFSIGTMPALVGVGMLGAFFERRFATAVRTVAVPLMLLSAATLALMGMDRLLGA